MKLDTFIDHLDRLGPDLDVWPTAARAAALALLATSADAASAMDRARQVQGLLSALPGRPAPAHLAGRIAARAVRPDQHRRSALPGWFGRTFWRPALAASVTLAIGFVLGFSYPQSVSPDDSYLLESIGMLPFSRSFEELPYEE